MSSPRSEAGFQGAAPIFAALGDATRIHMVARLCAGGPMSTAQLGLGIGVTRQAITKQLHVLADAGLVHASRRGRDQIWELERGQLEQARRCLDRISAQWDAALERLRAFVEVPEPDDP